MVSRINFRRAICVSLIATLAACEAIGTAVKSTHSLVFPKSTAQAGFPTELYARSIPPDNPQTPAKVALGLSLFIDRRLSDDKSKSCESCHDPGKGFTDQLPTSRGVDDQIGRRNAPTIVNAVFNITQFWDGRAASLEDQAKEPLLNPIEMGMKSPDAVVTELKFLPGYSDRFEVVFGRPVNFDDVARALAAYERTQVAFDSPFDHFIAGDQDAIDQSAKRGWALFNGRGGCVACHAFSPQSSLFTDNRFHNTGVSSRVSEFEPLARKALAVLARDDGARELDRLAISTDMSALGRFIVTRKSDDIGAFRTMGLRNLLVTQPYFHDGSQITLWQVLGYYNRGGSRNSYLDFRMRPLGLTAQEQDDLVAFLAALTSPIYADAARDEYDRQYDLSHPDGSLLTAQRTE